MIRSAACSNLGLARPQARASGLRYRPSPTRFARTGQATADRIPSRTPPHTAGWQSALLRTVAEAGQDKAAIERIDHSVAVLVGGVTTRIAGAHRAAEACQDEA